MAGPFPRVVSLDALPAHVRRSLGLSRYEGLFYALMVGFGETFFLADAVRRGAGLVQAALVVCLPLFVGAAGPLLVLRILRSRARRKPLVIAAIALQGLVLAFLSANARGPLATPEVLLAAVCLYQVCGQAAGTGWSSWFGDLVPQPLRGRYFAGRNRVVHLTTLLAVLTAGLLLERLEPGGAPGAAAGAELGRGFQWVFGLAALFRCLSAATMTRCHEPRFTGLGGPVQVLRFLSTERGSVAWRLVLGAALLQLSVYLSAPFFTPFMLAELDFSYLEYTAATVALVAVKVGFLPVWGARIDRLGARTVLRYSVLLIALVPLPFLFAQGLGLVLVSQMGSGLAWGGYEVSVFSLLLDSSYKRTRPAVFASMSVLNGTAQLAGVLLAAPVLALSGDPRTLFALSSLLRLAAGASLLYSLRAAGPPPQRRSTVPVLRTVGMRPHSGPASRPVDVGSDEDEPEPIRP